MKAEYQFLPLHQHFLTQQEATVVSSSFFFFHFFCFAAIKVHFRGDPSPSHVPSPGLSSAQNALCIFCLSATVQTNEAIKTSKEETKAEGRIFPRPSPSVAFLLFSMTSPWSDSESKYSKARTQLSSQDGKEDFSSKKKKKNGDSRSKQSEDPRRRLSASNGRR